MKVWVGLETSTREGRGVRSAAFARVRNEMVALLSPRHMPWTRIKDAGDFRMNQAVCKDAESEKERTPGPPMGKVGPSASSCLLSVVDNGVFSTADSRG